MFLKDSMYFSRTFKALQISLIRLVMLFPTNKKLPRAYKLRLQTGSSWGSMKGEGEDEPARIDRLEF